MKIKFLLALQFVVGLGFTSMAQTISFGPRIGATFANMKLTGDDASIEFKNTTGFQIGAVANFTVNEMFSIQPELLLVQKGFESGNDEDGTMKATLNYLEVPVLAKITFGTETFKGFITGGPTLGYAMSGTNSYELNGQEESEDIEFDDEEDNRFETGLSIGVGAGYKVGAGELNLDVRYGLGLSSLNKDNDEVSFKNRVIGVSVAYLFSL
jgi:hypothetical protein